MNKAFLIIDMPNSCADCPLFNDIYNDMNCRGANKRTIDYPYPADFRQEWCPLIFNESISEEISNLLVVKAEIDAFDEMKKRHPNTIPLSKAKFDEMMYRNVLDHNTFYYVIDEKIGRHIDGYMDI